MTLNEPRIARLAEANDLDFGPLSTYRSLLGGTGMPVFTGVQTCAPGYRTPLHSHPYVELLFILEGEAAVYFEGDTAPAHTLGPGDIVALPAELPHAFGTAGTVTMRLLGIHANPERIVEVHGDTPQDTHGVALARHPG
ncbi:MAG: cupin domain-containing protein [Burkholderiales bacterium]|nr:cupin domain-containing protein [Burkholderiales bacterium]